MGPLALEMSDCRESMEMQLQCFMCRLSSKAPCEPAQFLSPESRVLKPEASMAKSRCIMYAEIHGSTGQRKTGQDKTTRKHFLATVLISMLANSAVNRALEQFLQQCPATVPATMPAECARRSAHRSARRSVPDEF